MKKQELKENKKTHKSLHRDNTSIDSIDNEDLNDNNYNNNILIINTQPDATTNHIEDTNTNKNTKTGILKKSLLKKPKITVKSQKALINIKPPDIHKNLKKAMQDLEFKIKHNILNIFDIKKIDTSNIHSREDIERNYKGKLISNRLLLLH